ncbi:MAG: hypothetical protein ACI4XB_05875 [Ruminococcus sp.]
MKGSTIAAMVMAAAAASAATIFALKKAHDKKLESACNCDDLPEGGCRSTEEGAEENCFCEDSAEEACCCTEDDAESCCCEADDTAEEKKQESCCADGVCSFGGDDDAAVDQPAQIHMPEDLDAAADDDENA